MTVPFKWTICHEHHSRLDKPEPPRRLRGVVEAESLTAAALRLGVAKIAVSTHIQRLERELGAGQLVRTTRRLSPTETGATFYEAAKNVVRDAEVAG